MPSSDIVESARASLKDKDQMCPVMRRIASAPKGKEEDAVFKALDASGLMVDVKTTKVDLGDGLHDFPCFDPGDLIRKIAERGRIQNIIGEPWETCNSHAYSIICDMYTVSF